MKWITHLMLASMLCMGCASVDMSKLTDKAADELRDYLNERDDSAESGPVDAMDLTAIADWHGSELRSGPITVELRSAKMDRSFIHYDVNIPAHWPAKMYNDKPCVAHTVIVYLDDGKLVGGRYDHLSKGQTAKVHHNLNNGWNGLKFPPSNCWAFVAHEDGAERSNVVEVQR